MRVIVTGSRDWTDAQLIREQLAEMLARTDGALVVVHGACPTGADRIAAEWVAGFHSVAVPDSFGVTEEPHAADWTGPCRPECAHGPRRRRRDGAEYCPAAGNYRNDLMVRLGADFCLAFARRCTKRGPCRDRYGRPLPPGHFTHGTHDCAQLALAAGIEMDVRRQP